MVGEASGLLLSTLTVSEQRVWQAAHSWVLRPADGAGMAAAVGPLLYLPPPGVRSPAVP